MKRSEAIKMLVENYADEQYFNERHTDEILTLLENEGFLPPGIPTGQYNQTLTRVEYYPGGSHNIYDSSEIYENRWESEDEKI